MVLFRTVSEKLARLSGVVGVLGFEIDDESKTTGKIWEVEVKREGSSDGIPHHLG